MRSILALLVPFLLLAACRSPLGQAPDEPFSETDREVGRGIHGWPIFEKSYEGGGVRTDILFPLASLSTGDGDRTTRADFLFPIVHWSKESEDHIRYGLRPLFDYERRGENVDLDLPWPVFKWQSGEDHRRLKLATVLPLYEHEWWDDGHSLSAGLIYHEKESPEESYRWVWPLYGWSEERGRHRFSIIPPFFSKVTDEDRREVEWDLLLPLLQVDYTTDPDRDYVQWDVLWPLFHYGRDDDEVTARALPLFYQKAEGAETDRVLFPFWWQFDGPQDSFRMLFPIFGRQTEGRDFERTIVGGPLFAWTRDGDERMTDVLWPIVRHRSTRDGWRFRLFPVLWLRREEDESRTHLWPLLGYTRDRDGAEEYSTLWPFFRYERDEVASAVHAPWPFVKFEASESGHSSRVFPLFGSERTGKRSEGYALLYTAWWESNEERGTSDFRILYKLVQRTVTPVKSTTVVNPFFRYEENDRGDVYWSALFGLLARKRTGDEVDWRFLWVF